jgi:hypothetical protein
MIAASLRVLSAVCGNDSSCMKVIMERVPP